MSAEIREAPGGNSYTDYFSSLIDVIGGYQFQAGVRGNQSVQVNHGLPFLPQKGVPKWWFCTAAYTKITNDLTP